MKSFLSRLLSGLHRPIPISFATIRIGTGDILVLKTPGVLSHTAMERLRRAWLDAAPPGVKFMVLDGGADLIVLRKALEANGFELAAA